MKLVLRWILNAAALVLVTQVVPSVHVDGYGAALIAAVVLGLINVLVKPLLILFTLPATLLTLGLFLLVVNALCFWLAGSVLRGFVVDGFWGAFWGGLLYSLLTWAVAWLVEDERR